MGFKLIEDGISIVINGSFAPLSFRPDFLVKIGALDQAEADAATTPIVSQEFTSFGLPWIQMQVTLQQYHSLSIQPPHIRILDFSMACLAQIPATPITALGLIQHSHYKLDTMAQLQDLGDRIAPKAPWKDFLTSRGDVRTDGMRSLTMERVRTIGAQKGVTQVKVEPSVKVTCGVYFQIHIHFDLVRDGEAAEPQQVSELLALAWPAPDEISKQVANMLLGAK